MVTKEIIEGLNQIAKTNLRNYKHLVPMALFFKDGSMILPMATYFRNNEEKKQLYIQVGEAAKNINADEVVLIYDTARLAVASKEALREIIENPEINGPLAYPESMRVDSIFFQICDFRNNFKTRAWCQDYKKNKPLVDYVFEELKFIDASLGGDIQKWVKEGYKQSVEEL